MEPITHFLTGACLGRAGLNRKTGLATATVTLAAEGPDIDVLSRFKGPVFGFADHAAPSALLPPLVLDLRAGLARRHHDEQSPEVVAIGKLGESAVRGTVAEAVERAERRILESLGLASKLES